jgi:hypothetical protein
MEIDKKLQAEALIGRLTVEASKIHKRLKELDTEMQEAYSELEELTKEK